MRQQGASIESLFVTEACINMIKMHADVIESCTGMMAEVPSEYPAVTQEPFLLNSFKFLL